MSERYLLIDADNRFPLGPNGEPLLYDAPVDTPLATRVRAADGIVAARLDGTTAAALNPRTGDARSYAGHPLVARAIALLGAQERMRFDPRDGSQLTWDATGTHARSAAGGLVFPRIDPSVIGIVEHAGGEHILLGENAARPGYYSLIAGYVDVGETVEDAFAREVYEETGRRVDNVAYVRSQPWPQSGSLMLGFRATTADWDPVGSTDGELADIIWATRADLGALQLPMRGSIARQLIDDWERTAPCR